MRRVTKRIFCVVLFLLVTVAVPVWAGDGSSLLSANIPFGSEIYNYISKLEGLGYLSLVATGTKPYSRLRVAEWVLEVKGRMAAEADVPAYAQTLLGVLETEFQRELAVLRGEGSGGGLLVRGVDWANTYYEGHALAQHRTLSTYQPLNINNDGDKYAEGLNTAFTVRIETGSHHDFVASLTPRFSYDDDEEADLTLKAGYFKTRLGNLEIQAGKEAMWWGQGERGSRVLTNNSTPQTALKLSNVSPIPLGGWLGLLRQMNATFFYTELESDRSDVPDPSFTGLRADFSPTADFTFAGSLTAFLGGEGHALHGDDYWDFLIGENALTPAEDKWNIIAGFDLRWRIPRWNGFQFYLELYGEDQAGSLLPWPSKNAWIAGIYLPRLTPDGAWDLTIEAAETGKAWYVHSLYTNGYTYRGDLIGDAMGNDAERYYVKLTNYTPAGARWALHGEYLKMAKTSARPQEVLSRWVTFHTRICGDLLLEATAGVAEIDNENFQAGKTATNYIISFGLTKNF
ncbi:MAG TPA: capsule assembly Wzi family protein [Firmicutes bacterium]|nr:capsule assembly Wzi family protein [Bacillota bacterium]